MKCSSYTCPIEIGKKSPVMLFRNPFSTKKKFIDHLWAQKFLRRKGKGDRAKTFEKKEKNE